ncbi:UNVERIFIED_CONTAM: hypothetical protein RMT77_010545 [Armadillidium vulgare]
MSSSYNKVRNEHYTNIKTRNEYRYNAENAIYTLNQLLNCSEYDSTKIKNVVEKLKSLKKNLSSYDEAIQVMLGENDFVRDMEEASILSANIDEAVNRAELIIEEVAKGTNELPKFNGDPLEWFRFWETFESTIHSKAEITDTCKLSCLKGQLEGWPLELIKGLPSRDPFYHEAIKLLKATFGNEKTLIESHLHAIFDLESPSPMPASLMKFSSDFEYHIRALKSFKTDIEDAGFVIATILNRKLPAETWNNINRTNRQTCWTLDEFRKALNYEIQFLLGFEYAQKFRAGTYDVPTTSLRLTSFQNAFYNMKIDKTPVLQKQKQEKSVKKPNTKIVNGSKASSASASASPKEEPFRHVCKLCFADHQFDQCTKYKLEQEKCERAMELNLCLMCLKNDHSTMECKKKNRKTCKHCSGFHHTSLCMKAEFKKKEKKN